MQSKFEQFNELPELTKKQTSKYHFALFKPMTDVRKLSHHVTRGEHDAVKAMLKKDMSLIFKRDKVTDCSGREFENTSAFEYTLWALDKHMWAAMIECIPLNEKGRKVFAELIAQYNKVNTDGVTYRLSGKTITEQHFDFENIIIKELQTQVDSLNASGEKNWDAIDKQWLEGVGGAQKRLPMHIVDEYCSNEPFYPVPTFTTQPKSSKQFYDWSTEKDENWFSISSKLSVDFVMYRLAPWGRGLSFASSAPRWWRGAGVGGQFVTLDLVAMTALCKVRTNDFIELKSQLEDQMMLDNLHQVSQI